MKVIFFLGRYFRLYYCLLSGTFTPADCQQIPHGVGQSPFRAAKALSIGIAN